MVQMMTCRHYGYCDYRILEGGCPKKCDTFCHVKNRVGTPYAPGLENPLNILEITYWNGQEAAKNAIIGKLMERKVTAKGTEHAVIAEIVEMVRKVEIAP